MEKISIINKREVAQNKKIKQAQRKARRYYEEKVFEKVRNAPKAKIRKIVELDDISFAEYRTSNNKADKISAPELSKEQLIELCKKA